MVDADLIRKKLAFIDTCLRELRELARPERLESDVREERFVVHSLQLCVQAALDAASHIVSDRRLGEPGSNRELFELLRRDGWLPCELAAHLQDMAGFRNVAVHGYQTVDLGVVRDILEHRLGDLDEFCTRLRGRLEDG